MSQGGEGVHEQNRNPKLFCFELCIAPEKWQVLVSDAAGSPFWGEVTQSRSALLTCGWLLPFPAGLRRCGCALQLAQPCSSALLLSPVPQPLPLSSSLGLCWGTFSQPAAPPRWQTSLPGVTLCLKACVVQSRGSCRNGGTPQKDGEEAASSPAQHWTHASASGHVCEAAAAVCGIPGAPQPTLT